MTEKEEISLTTVDKMKRFEKKLDVSEQSERKN